MPSPSLAVKTNWTAFFDGATSASRRVALLQNGAAFAKIIEAQSKSAMAKAISVKVTDVTIHSATEAGVTYTLYLSGSPVLSDLTGTAVREAGTWKVSTRSFCPLLQLEGVRAAACQAG